MFFVVVLQGWYSFNDQKKQLKEHLYEEGQETSKILAISSASYLISNDLAGLEQILIQSATDADILGLEVIQKNGDVINKITHNKGFEPIADYDFSNIKTPEKKEYIIKETEHSIIAWHPIEITDFWGWIKIVYGKQQIDAIRVTAWQHTLTSSLIIFIVSFLILRILLRPHIRSISAATDFATVLSNSKGEQMDICERSYEIERLTSALNLASTNLHLQAKEINDNHAYIQLLLDSISEAVFGIDKNKKCTFINKSCLKALGFSDPNEIIGKEIVEIISLKTNGDEKKSITTHNIYNTIFEDYAIHEEKVIFTRKDGEQFPAEYWSNPINKGNKAIGAVITFIDITLREEANNKRRQLESQLQQAQKMESIGQLTGGIAHDFNNILAYVIGYIELVLDMTDESRDKTIYEYLNEAHSGGIRAQELVAQMLAFGRIITGKIVPVKLDLTIKEILGLLYSILPSTITIETDISDNLEPIMIDSTQFHQILMNLCINAKDAMLGHGTIKIQLAQENVKNKIICDSCHHSFEGEYQVLMVSDTGEGMELDVIEKIFEPFFSTKEVGKGSGMGLSMVHGLLHECKGHLRVESKPGHGTEFKLYFPTSQNISLDIPEENTQIAGHKI